MEKHHDIIAATCPKCQATIHRFYYDCFGCYHCEETETNNESDSDSEVN